MHAIKRFCGYIGFHPISSYGKPVIYVDYFYRKQQFDETVEQILFNEERGYSI